MKRGPKRHHDRRCLIDEGNLGGDAGQRDAVTSPQRRQSETNCTGGTCDYNADGCVDVLDLLKFLAHLTPDPAGIGCPP